MASDENVAFLLSIVDNQLDPTEAAQLLKVRRDTNTCLDAADSGRRLATTAWRAP
jgi:hypothetical protein